MNAENMYDAWDNGDRHEIRQQFARREEIIRMAREALERNVDYNVWTISTPHLEEFARLVAAAEREACAKVCEDIYNDPKGNDGYDAYYTRPYLECADAIRARGDNNAS